MTIQHWPYLGSTRSSKQSLPQYDVRAVKWKDSQQFARYHKDWGWHHHWEAMDAIEEHRLFPEGEEGSTETEIALVLYKRLHHTWAVIKLPKEHGLPDVLSREERRKLPGRSDSLIRQIRKYWGEFYTEWISRDTPDRWT